MRLLAEAVTVQENAKLAAEQVKLLHIILSVIKEVKKFAFRRIIENVIYALGRKNASTVEEKERLMLSV